MQIDNDKCRRDRETRLSGSRLDLAGLCDPRGASRTAGVGGSHNGGLDSHGNSLPPLSPQSINNNNNNPLTSDIDQQQPQQPAVPLTPSGKHFYQL